MIYSRRPAVLEVMQPPGTRMTSQHLCRLLEINSKRASTLLAEMYYDGVLQRERIPHPSMQGSRWRYFIDRKLHRPELWNDQAMANVMACMDSLVRERHA